MSGPAPALQVAKTEKKCRSMGSFQSPESPKARLEHVEVVVVVFDVKHFGHVAEIPFLAVMSSTSCGHAVAWRKLHRKFSIAPRNPSGRKVRPAVGDSLQSLLLRHKKPSVGLTRRADLRATSFVAKWPHPLAGTRESSDALDEFGFNHRSPRGCFRQHAKELRAHLNPFLCALSIKQPHLQQLQIPLWETALQVTGQTPWGGRVTSNGQRWRIRCAAPLSWSCKA
jgi:hypothetical protein